MPGKYPGNIQKAGKKKEVTYFIMQKRNVFY
jgi:hypothetical protein